jgi:hypothetical protein
MNTFIGFVTPQGKLLLDFPTAFKAYVRKFAGDEVELEIRRKREKRSLRQNAAFWAMLTEWARSEGWTLDDLKDAVMAEAFGTEEITMPITGELRRVPAKRHSSALTVTEFVHLIEETMRLAAECGVVLMAPDEYKKAKEVAQKKAARQAA